MAVPAGNVIGSNLPLPGVYKERQLQAEQAYQQALASLSAEERGQFQEYGFRGTVDPASGATNFQLDATQNFGAAQNLLRQHASGLRSLRQQMTGRGLGNKGLAAKRANLARFMQGSEVASLGKNFARNIAGIQGRRAAALNQKNADFSGAENDALQYAIQNGLFNEPAPETGGQQSYGFQMPQEQVYSGDWRDEANMVTPDQQYYTSGYSPGVPGGQLADTLFGTDPQTRLASTLSRTRAKYGEGVYY